MAIPTQYLAIREFIPTICIKVMCFPCTLSLSALILMHKSFITSYGAMVMGFSFTFTISTRPQISS